MVYRISAHDLKVSDAKKCRNSLIKSNKIVENTVYRPNLKL